MVLYNGTPRQTSVHNAHPQQVLNTPAAFRHLCHLTDWTAACARTGQTPHARHEPLEKLPEASHLKVDPHCLPSSGTCCAIHRRSWPKRRRAPRQCQRHPLQQRQRPRVTESEVLHLHTLTRAYPRAKGDPGLMVIQSGALHPQASHVHNPWKRNRDTRTSLTRQFLDNHGRGIQKPHPGAKTAGHLTLASQSYSNTLQGRKTRPRPSITPPCPRPHSPASAPVGVTNSPA